MAVNKKIILCFSWFVALTTTVKGKIKYTTLPSKSKGTEIELWLAECLRLCLYKQMSDIDIFVPRFVRVSTFKPNLKPQQNLLSTLMSMQVCSINVSY
jgi:hypothetical protein